MNDDDFEKRLSTLEQNFWMEKGRNAVMERAIKALLADMVPRNTELVAATIQSFDIKELRSLPRQLRDAFDIGKNEGLLQLRRQIAEL